MDEPAAAGRRRGAPVSGAAAHDAAGGAGRGLGAGFARLWAAAAISNVRDAVDATALPLLAASLTRDPLAVSLVTFGEWLPSLLFGLVSGALLDRWERRRVMWTVDAARFAVVGGLAVAVVLDRAGIALLAAAGGRVPVLAGGPGPAGGRRGLLRGELGAGGRHQGPLRPAARHGGPW